MLTLEVHSEDDVTGLVTLAVHVDALLPLAVLVGKLADVELGVADELVGAVEDALVVLEPNLDLVLGVLDLVFPVLVAVPLDVVALVVRAFPVGVLEVDLDEGVHFALAVVVDVRLDGVHLDVAFVCEHLKDIFD